MKASVKYLDGTKWKPLDMKEVAGNSIAYIMSKDSRTMVAALFDCNEKPCFFVTNSKIEYEKYKERAYTMMVDDLILLLGSETIQNTPLTTAIIKTFPDAKFEVIAKEESKGGDSTK